MNPAEFERLRDVLVGALKLPLEERGSFIDRECGANSVLGDAARMLLAHDAGEDALGRLHDQGAAGRGLGIHRANTDVSEPDPETIGPYEILHRLGEGGMGIVYLGVDPSLGRRVAIKVLPEALARDDVGLERLREEARLLARLNHPNIATVHSLEHDGARMFLTMELVEGTPLTSMPASEPLALDEALDRGCQIARALEVAHEKGIVHRDLKPSNILVTASGAVKILDFGLAKLVRGSAREVTTRRATSTPGAPIQDRTLSDVAGTPGYMSPEQIRGERVDERCDVWAFGCLLYELVTGHRAFAGPPLERLDATLRGAVDLDRLDDRLPPEIRALLETCLSPDRSKRLPSIREARRALEDAQEKRSLAQLRHRLAEELKPAGDSLPRYMTTFVGREHETERIVRLLDGSRVVVLTGFGGTGKTRLAVELADRLGDRFPDACWFVDIGATADPATVTQRVLSAMGLREERERSPLETLLASLASLRALVILDNCEHVVEACSELAAALAASCPSIRILATSREPLTVDGARIHRLEPLRGPAREATLPESRNAPAVRLLVDRATVADPGFEVTDANVNAVGELCRRLDGLPLAIELAATQLDVLTPAELVREFDRFARLGQPSARGPERHRSLTALVGWSYEQLRPAERALFRRLSVFRGGWTLAAAQAVCTHDAAADGGLHASQVLELARTLLSKSLIVRDTRVIDGAEQSRYRMLETIREYALAQLEARGEVATTRARHFGHFCGLVSAVSWQRGASETWMARISADEENILTALTEPHYADHSLADVSTMLRKLLYYWTLAGIWEAPERCCAAVIRAFEDRGETGSRHHARALYAAARLASLRGDFARARPRLLECRRIAEALGDRELQDDCDETLTQTLEGNHEEGLDLANGRVQRWEAIVGDERPGSSKVQPAHGRLATALMDRSQRLLQLGRCTEAESDVRRALSIREALGDVDFVPILQGVLGGVRHRLGDIEGARALYVESLDRMQARGQVNNNTVAALLNLGQLDLELSDDESAGARAKEAYDLAIRLGSGRRALHALYLSGLSAVTTQPDVARERLERCLAESRTSGYRIEEAHALHGLIHLEIESENYDVAWRHGREILGLLSERRGPLIASTLAAAARARLGMGAAEDAAVLLGAAEQAIAESDATWPKRNETLVADWTRAVREALTPAAFEDAFGVGRREPLAELLERRSWARSTRHEAPESTDVGG